MTISGNETFLRLSYGHFPEGNLVPRDDTNKSTITWLEEEKKKNVGILYQAQSADRVHGTVRTMNMTEGKNKIFEISPAGTSTYPATNYHRHDWMGEIPSPVYLVH